MKTETPLILEVDLYVYLALYSYFCYGEESPIYNGPAFVRRAVRTKLMDLPFDANARRKTRNRGESARNAC
jgi:hypothetical protein